MLSVGGKAPDFVLPTLSGIEVSLGEMTRSGPVLLAFFKISCPTCQYTFPFLERLAAAPQLTDSRYFAGQGETDCGVLPHVRNIVSGGARRCRRRLSRQQRVQNHARTIRISRRGRLNHRGF